MTRKYYLGLTLFCALILTVIAIFQSAPGYMDAEYYYGMGLRIVNDKTLTEPFVWNYLHEQRALPHPGFTYWQPLPALVAASGLYISRASNFLNAKIPFLLIYSLVPFVTSYLVWELTSRKEVSILAGIFALFPVFYAPFIGTTDSFGMMMLLGGLFFVAYRRRNDRRYFLVLGLASGLIHLARADGLIWVGIGLLGCILEKNDRVKNASLFLIGYLVIMGPWFTRNMIELGELLPSSAGRMFWLKEYNDIFEFNPETLNFTTWKGQGWETIAGNISQAFTTNLRTLVFVQGQLIMAPVAAYGFWSFRKNKVVQLGGMIYAAIFILMTVVFPFAGWRGGFFHAGAGLQPLIWGMSALGFGLLIDLAVKRRNWIQRRAFTVFGAGLVITFMISAGYVFFTRVYGEDPAGLAWTRSERGALEIASELRDLEIPDSSLVMINNPPGLYAATGRSSIVIPDGPIATIIQAADEFGARLLILEANHTPNLKNLYENPSDTDQLKWIHSGDGVHYFLIKD